ncbi:MULTISPECIES: ABC transporter permease [unclassified Rhodococcus (in: high G+C Gram-positive bacteria)]|uniref:ABC transporter permease n=1 Tax=unclassified Rhodococcus (in: high G+C Gram-positive bacteria) TaxID=192944 RepID=UPI00169F451C|nr:MULTISPECIES: ABC transporter permease [unclassified Rhodococcus (in: high G+C Gram-positive bacteria)]NIL78016.1 hypothetical protein [Rhodococcus sp. B10]
MTTQSHEGTSAAPHSSPSGGGTPTPTRDRKRLPKLGLDRFSGLYVWVAIIVLFAIWIPDTFLTEGNFRIIAGDQAITAMLAIGLIVPLAAGVFDLSIAGVMGFSVAMVSYQLSQGIGAPVAVVTTLLCGALIGAVNGFVVVKLGVDSFIATLGMSSILLAGTYWVTDGKQITEGFTDGFLDMGSKPFLGLPLPFFYMIVVAAVMYVVLEKTPLGRYLYATGGNRQAARLAGLRVERIMFGALVTSATVAASTGVVLAAKLGTAAPDIGPSYLLPAFSAVFLGSTQIRAGRVNVLGTLIAIYLLATGVKGLQLAGSPSFVNDLFNGLALIVAVALAARTARRK